MTDPTPADAARRRARRPALPDRAAVGPVRRDRGEPGPPVHRSRRHQDPSARGPEPAPRGRGADQAHRRGRSRLRRLHPAGAAVRRTALDGAVGGDARADPRADPPAGRPRRGARGPARSRAARRGARRRRRRTAPRASASRASSASTDRAGSSAASSAERRRPTSRPPRRSKTCSARSSWCAADRRCRRATSSRCRCRRPRAPRERRAPPRPPPPAPTSRPSRRPPPTLLGAALGGAARRAGLDPAEGKSTGHVVWHAMGGWRGILESVLPGLVFIIACTLTIDPATGRATCGSSLGLSVGLAAVFTIVRLDRASARRAPRSAASSRPAPRRRSPLFTGRGENNFIPGFVTNAAVRHGVPRVGAHRLVAHRARRRLPDGGGHRVARATSASAARSSGSRSRGRRCSPRASSCSCRSTSPATSRRSERSSSSWACRCSRRMVAVTWLAVRALYPPPAEVIHLS